MSSTKVRLMLVCFAIGFAWPVAMVSADASQTAVQGSIVSSVVRLSVVADPPDLLMPWQTEGIDDWNGSGAIIEGKGILTNAHVVEDAVAIEVKRADGRERFPARVKFISHDSDLALVEVDDPRFFEGTKPIPIGRMPKLLQQVIAYGFPIGGTTLSITSGIVSRVELSTYSQSNRALLAVQIDAAINPGNSGGPVVSDGAIVGVAMQGIDDADNVGYMIPAPVVRHFLEDVADGRYDGFPMLGAEVQQMESQAQRRAAGMKPGQTGGLVTRVDYGGPAYGALKPRDVVLSIDQHPVANDLTVFWKGIGRVDYELTFQSKQVGDSVAVTILRQGKKLKETITLKPHTLLVPGRRTTERPRYLVFGGLVMQPLSVQLLKNSDLYPDSQVFARLENFVTKELREVIVLQQVLPHPVNRGYQDWGGDTIRLINGVVPRDLDHLAEIIDGAQGRWLRIVTGDGFLLTLDTRAARAASEEILDAYGIAEDRYLGPAASSEPRRRRRRR